MTRLHLWTCSLLPMILVAPAIAAEPTPIRITDQVVVKDAIRLGINTGGDNYWDGSVVKVRAAENFEGVLYRMISWGPELDENGLAVWFSPPKEAWDAMKGKVRFTLLGPPNKGVQGVIRDITTKKIRDGRTITYLVFDRKVQPGKGSKNGILLEYEDLDQGSIRESSNTPFWNTAANTAHLGDVPPGTFGKAALWLRPAEGETRAHYTFVPMWATQAEQNGTWRIQLWAKRKAGSPKLVVTTESAASATIELTDEWKHHDLSLAVSGLTGDKNVTIRLVADGGKVLVDDVVIWKDEGSRNPTAFRDPLVDLLQKLRPGTLRMLQMGGSDLANNLRPRLKQMGWSRDFRNLVRGGRNHAKTYKFNLHDYYVLCEHVGADPWYCLPGTVHPEEIPILMEYLAGPPDKGWGKARAEMGHPKPWTEVFKHIYIEFGNEAWNAGGYATGSFNGPDHWNDLFAAARSSEHFRPNIVFVAGSQAASTGVTRGVLRDVPNADSYSIAPYMMNGMRAEYLEHLKTDDELFRWVFAYALRRVLDPTGRVYQQDQLTREAGKALSIYEHNFHMTTPTPERGGVDVETRNRIQTSLGAGLTVINDALLMMRERHIHVQCQFNLRQRSYRSTRLWGFVPGLNVHDQRYRPHFLAEQIANNVIAGDMLETEHGPGEPTFAADGHFESDRKTRKQYSGFPALWSYAFRDGARRGLIVFNLDTTQPRSVRLDFDGKAAKGQARAWWLAADKITANNEPEHEPQVKPRQEDLTDFGAGKVLQLPPHSMLGVVWEQEQP
jgi:hypothetical protein